jgi:hypothetical protein
LPADSLEYQSIVENQAFVSMDNQSDIDSADSLFHSLENANVCEVSETGKSLLESVAIDQSSQLFVSLPNADQQMQVNVGSVQPLTLDESAQNVSHVGNTLNNSQSSAAVISLDSEFGKTELSQVNSECDEEVNQLAASLQGSILSPQFDDIGTKSFQLANHLEDLMVSSNFCNQFTY